MVKRKHVGAKLLKRPHHATVRHTGPPHLHTFTNTAKLDGIAVKGLRCRKTDTFDAILHDAGIHPAPERTSTTWSVSLCSQANIAAPLARTCLVTDSEQLPYRVARRRASRVSSEISPCTHAVTYCKS